MRVAQTLRPITAECLIQDVVERHPQTIIVFARHGMQCAGCYMSPFHTVADSAYQYTIALDLLLDALNRAAA